MRNVYGGKKISENNPNIEHGLTVGTEDRITAEVKMDQCALRNDTSSGTVTRLEVVKRQKIVQKCPLLRL